MDTFVSNFLSVLIKDIGQSSALIIFSLVMIRIIMIVNLVPFLGSKNAPGPVKIGFSVLLTLLMWPMVMANIHGPVPDSIGFYLVMILKEALVGFTIGFVTSKIFYAVEMSGQLIDVFRGTNQVQLMVPELQERSSAYGTMYYQLMIVLFLAADLHVIFFHGLTQSFVAVPINVFPAMSRGTSTFFEFISHLLPNIFLIAVTLALPVAAVCFIIDIAFGLMNRIAPQINAYFMAMPAKALGGVTISFAALFMTLKQLGHFSKEMLQKLLQLIELLR
jgi:flagellar biosynthesis protein FliR